MTDTESKRRFLMVKNHNSELVSHTIGRCTEKDLETLTSDQRTFPGEFICLYDLKNKCFWPLNGQSLPHEISADVKNLIHDKETEYHTG